MKITRNRDSWSVDAGALRLRLRQCRGSWGYDFELLSGKAWKLVGGSERNRDTLGAETIVSGPFTEAGGKVHAFSLFPSDIQVLDEKAVVILRGSLGGDFIEQKITLFDGETRLHIDTSFHFEKAHKLSRIGVPVVFIPDGKSVRDSGGPDFMWIPLLRKIPEHVIPDQIFRSPAAIVQKGGYAMALVPDLDVLRDDRPMPACLDMQLERSPIGAPWLWYGFAPHTVDGHVFFRHAPDKAAAIEKARIAFNLLLDTAAPQKDAHRRVVSFLWDRYGAPNMESVEPQAAEFDVYDRHGVDYAFDNGKIYREFEVDGKKVAGTLALSFASAKHPHVMDKRELKESLSSNRLVPALHGFAVDKLLRYPAMNDLMELYVHYVTPSIAPLIANQSFFNNFRSAYGLRAFAERTGDSVLRRRADLMKEHTLASPAEKGVWPTMCYFPEDEVWWYEGCKMFESVRQYHLPDNAWTGVWMLNWYEDVEKDERLLEKAKAFGEFLLEAADSSGAFPSWVSISDSGYIEAKPTLNRSAQTAAPGLFLTRLATATGDKRYLSAAKKAADFMIRKVFPEDKWWDSETFFSCSKKDRGMRDAGTGLHCMNSLCIFWTAEFMRRLYSATGAKKYLDAGLHAIDMMCLWQQVWDAPYVSINTFGGFGVMNTDAEWNDARQSMFSETLAGYFELTGDRRYFERAVAALRSSYTLMICPENKDVAPGNLGRMRAKDIGAMYENYAHLGYDRRAPGYVMFDWGSGGAMSATQRIRRSYGDIFIDFPTQSVFGIDFCIARNLKVTSKSVSFELKKKGAPREMRIVSHGAHAGKRDLIINNKKAGRYDGTDFEKGILSVL